MEQENVENHYQDISFGLLSPPPSSPPPSVASTKTRKPPPITPRRFTKFFTPRNLSSGGSKFSRTLRDITFNASNQQALDQDVETRPAKRRRKLDTIRDGLSSSSYPESYLPSSPPPSSPCRHISLRYSEPSVQRIARPYVGLPQSVGTNQTAEFCSDHQDIHEFATPQLPFCVQACNTNSLVAVGTETGHIRIIETAIGNRSCFADAYLAFRPHNNAIMNLAFSHNDHYLATASGDQTSRVIDMFTQQTIYVLDEHTYSVKDVSFLPDNDKVIATCGRDGAIGLWDIRCRSTIGPAYRNLTARSSAGDGNVCVDTLPHVGMYSSIMNAHATLPSMSSRSSTTPSGARQTKASQPPAITSLKFLPVARGGGNLFLTSCADSAQLRLWDVRGKYSSRRGAPVPLSTTAPISTHDVRRSYGVNSISLSTDAARLFAICRDSTVYAYSTNHLMLGQSVELDSGRCKDNRKWSRGGTTGADPLYGMRNPQFRTGSFYVGSSIRRAAGAHTELLAVGSSDRASVLFPTDEKLFHDRGERRSSARYIDRVTGRATLSLATSRSGLDESVISSESLSFERGLPIYTMGTPLIRGHNSEVSSMSWTSDGELVTVSDDHTARVWREDAIAARELRIGGEGEGKRWKCGWAQVDDEAFDESEDEI